MDVEHRQNGDHDEPCYLGTLALKEWQSPHADHDPLSKLKTDQQAWTEVWRHLLQARAPEQTSDDIERTFKELALRWSKETRALSVVKRKAMHWAYQRIIGLGPSAVPLILRELAERPDDWMWALNAITREDPAPEDATFNEAVNAWLAWGKQKGLFP